ncbi:RES family NAD+ phosphorylase [Mucilaginibacter glaciei]|uniref:RES family NAD+ phosphorylase n=1 Tax=Mucilaginibacter glaciei TaxID=2772109 RepID=A0A926S3M7_9SPHI|nr:RES family NAD+ phosphorylase [Mucilaginibacter glaciei]MBD1394404.1 RES family NAD+ phosphorylase [Mucilaginibacter glaciei]
MILYRIASCDYVDNLDGTGARLYGARWNSKGTAAVYMASSRALAALEVLVHIPPLVSPANFCLAEVKVPDNSILTVDVTTLPNNWKSQPPPASLKEIGNQFIKDAEYLMLKIPSAIVSQEFNYLLNPHHPDMHKVKVMATHPFNFDERLL